MRSSWRILAVMALVLVSAACSRHGKVIPRSKFATIYAEMLLADQWLDDHYQEKTKADTTLFYDSIFKRFGYSFEDYDASVNHYLADPEKFSKILKRSAKMLRAKGKHYEELDNRIREIQLHNAAIKGYRRKAFSDSDTFFWRRAVDTAALDSLVLDSLWLDSLRLDSLVMDSLLRDSLIRDSLVRDSISLDSVKRHSVVMPSMNRVTGEKFQAERIDRP